MHSIDLSALTIDLIPLMKYTNLLFPGICSGSAPEWTQSIHHALSRPQSIVEGRRVQYV